MVEISRVEFMWTTKDSGFLLCMLNDNDCVWCFVDRLYFPAGKMLGCTKENRRKNIKGIWMLTSQNLLRNKNKTFFI